MIFHWDYTLVTNEKLKNLRHPRQSRYKLSKSLTRGLERVDALTPVTACTLRIDYFSSVRTKEDFNIKAGFFFTER